ncbi:MAG: hypothetical protein K1X57_19410 [Gemmataceae bacterium]|nr:hypothetical protein [Gemmataceae bacterium]
MPDSRLDTLTRRFLDRTLPRKEWTHEAHLRVGLWHLLRYTPEESLDRLRTGIREYNIAVGVQNTATAGYHETITRYYVMRIARFLDGADRSLTDDELSENLIQEIGDRELPLRHWTRERLFSPEARQDWVEPDLTPLIASTVRAFA